MASDVNPSPSETPKTGAGLRFHLPLVLAMVFASGFAGLVYQVLWMKQLGLLFGNTAQATSTTLAAFFAGLGCGSWWWGRRTGGSSNPLRLYALLETGIALTALIYFAILKIFYAVYPQVYGSVSAAAWMLAVKFGLSLLLVFPPAFFMGGTVPAIGQALIRTRDRFGRRAALIYAINTLGAALGVIGAVFVLIPSLGFRWTYGLVILLSAGTAIVSWHMSRRAACETGLPGSEPILPDPAAKDLPAGERGAGRVTLRLLCFFSGFTILALEVIWTRIFAQVHENSVYSFAIILTVVLLCLALGAWISAALSRLDLPPLRVLARLMVIGGIVLVIGPWLLMEVTGDLRPLQSVEPWSDYVRRLFKMGFGGIGVVVIALGTVFPFLMKAAERDAVAPGRTLGRLLAINTAGAITGALVAGFLLLPTFGIWKSMQFLTVGYVLVGMLVPSGLTHGGLAWRAVGLACLALSFSVLNPSHLPSYGSRPGDEDDTVLHTWEGSDCTVSVVERESGHLAVKVNGAYTLGSTAAYVEQANQARIPLSIFPETESICFIGLGTGMSAGAALESRFPNVKRVVTCELTPAVVEAARDYIPHGLTHGLFTDTRSTVLVEDGRHYLTAGGGTFDMIDADLFLPYRRGAGSLYSLEHFRTAAERLGPDGVFVQWLPLYQLTEDEFGVIARTMLEAFDQVTMWRNNFAPGREKVALIGQRRATPLPVPSYQSRTAMLEAVEGLEYQQALPDMVKVDAETILFFYCGNVTAARSLFESYPINTDDRPVIEYQTPRRFREIAERDSRIWFVGPKIAELTRRILTECPVTGDPALDGHPPASRRLVVAGAAFHQAMIAKSLGEPDRGRSEWEIFKRQWRMSAR